MRWIAAIAISACFLGTVITGCTGEPPAAERNPVYSPFHHNQHNAIVRVPQPRRRVALTFDDGPHRRLTPLLVRLLARRHVRATFFVIGKSAIAHPALIRALLRGGHGVENHTFTHAKLTRVSRYRIAAEIAHGSSAIESAGAPAPKLFRPPLGAFDERVGAVTAEAGQLMIGWDLPLDRYIANGPVSRGVDRLLADLRPGSIVLLHAEGGRRAARARQALRLLIAGLPARGFRAVTLGELLDGHV